MTLRLWQQFKPELHRAQVTTVYETMERPLVPVLAKMEMAGVKVDRDTLSRMSNAFAQKMARAGGRVARAGPEKGLTFNHLRRSAKFCSTKCHCRAARKPRPANGQPRPTCWKIWPPNTTFRPAFWTTGSLQKLKSTYTDSLLDHINAKTGRVHTSYAIAGANTGRLASTDPNLQNIPVRTEDGRRIREAFIVEPGKVLVSLDYSQIELRILAHTAGIDALKSAFREGQDIHAMTAAEMFDVPLDAMTPDVRRQAKAINFGVIYGISAGVWRAICGFPAKRRRPSSTAISSAFPAFALTWTTRWPLRRSTGSSKRFRPAKSTRPRLTRAARTGLCQARRDQCPDPGHGGRYHPPRDDPDG